MIVGHLRADPDITIVAKDDTCSAEKVVEMVLAAFDERGRYNRQCASSKLKGNRRG